MRVGILVTDHALERARERFGLANIDRKLIHDDVRDGLLARRGGRQIPVHSSRPPCEGNALYVWTPRGERIYIVEGVKRGRRSWLSVVSAIPGVYRDDIDWPVAA